MVDINLDGYMDIYLSVGGKELGVFSENLLFINNGDLTFTERAKEYGLNEQKLTTHAAFFDYDQDGDLDVYMINYENNANKDPNTIRPKKFSGKSISNDKLYRNDNGYFEDVSIQAGINQEAYGLGVAITDFDDDGWLDVYVSNDFAYDDIIYINNQDGTFTDRLKDYVSHTSNFGMGIDMGDLNNDGFLDIVQVDMLPEDNRRQKKILGGLNYDRMELLLKTGHTAQYMRNSLQLNAGDGSFQEIGLLAGISNTDWSWGPLIADLDNDGLKDIYITNGYVKDVTDIDFRDYIVNESRKTNAEFDPKVITGALETLKGEKVANYAYKNTGDYTFTNKSRDWGLGTKSFSAGAAYGDLDNDGDLDLVVNNLNNESFVYRNNTQELDSLNYMSIDLSIDGNQTKAIGSQIKISSGGNTYFAEMSPYKGFQSSVDPTIHLGLGYSDFIDTLMITWPDNSQLIETNIRANQHLEFQKEKILTTADYFKASLLKDPIFEPRNKKYNLAYKHQESHFVDFKREALLPHKLSTEGPSSAYGDINNDGLVDIFIGGAANVSGEFLIQTKNQGKGKFKHVKLDQDKRSEDAAALLFDYDNDKDLDLYVVSGSNEFTQGSDRYADRLYVNDGYGNFTRDMEAIPSNAYSGSTVAASDFDNDGDLDLFVGGRSNPGNYPLPGTSQLLRNDNGKFTNVTDEIAPGLSNIGMVKDAQWADLDMDGSNELVLAGEFMPISIYGLENGKMTNQTAKYGLQDYVGWWNTLQIEDIDKDGDLDILGGNLGLNSRYKASIEEPLSIYANDYDKNGTLDAIVGHYVQGKEYVMHDLTTLAQQVVGFKKRFTKNIEYAEASLEDVLRDQEMKQAKRFMATHFETSLFLNSNGSFELQKLPKEVQFSTVRSVVTFDYDRDGHLDILLGGNSHDAEVFNGRYDAQASVLLKGLGNGEFKTIPKYESAFVRSGAISDMHVIEVNKQPHVFALRNNDYAQIFGINSQASLSKAQSQF